MEQEHEKLLMPRHNTSYNSIADAEQPQQEQNVKHDSFVSNALWLTALLPIMCVGLFGFLIHLTVQPSNVEKSRRMDDTSSTNTFSVLEAQLNKWEEWKHKIQSVERSVQDWIHNETSKHHAHEPQTDLVYFNNTHAFDMLLLTFPSMNQDYFLVTPGWDAQINQAYCAVATSVAVLNSFRHDLSLPLDGLYDPYPYATQHDVWNDCTNSKVVHQSKDQDGVLQVPGGLGMLQTKNLLECNLPKNFVVSLSQINPVNLSLQQMKHDLQLALQNDNSRVMINYHRATAQQVGGGHWSPIVSYNMEMDSFLLLDVAKYKYPPVWIPSLVLYNSMATLDPCGSWDFPKAQEDIVTQDNFQTPATQEEYQHLMKELNCQSTYRGYIIVERVEK